MKFPNKSHSICFLTKFGSLVLILTISGPYDVISKKFKKLLISRFLVSEWFFRSKNVLIVISSKNAAKWCVTWPFFEYDLENPQFHHYFRNFIRTSGSKICWSQNKYFSNQCKKCFDLRYNLNNLSQIFLFHIMTVRDLKMFLVVSSDLSTDRHQMGLFTLGNSLFSDKSQKK